CVRYGIASGTMDVW
nr:immunoglobulin heavy chain junction region [Macaca mulatta]MOW49064.1 immunoglobulin heavy chain junction region [Macaca mulatta]